MAIDVIFLSPEPLSHAWGRFLAFEEATHSNHRAVWIDICSELVDFTNQKRSSGPRHEDLNIKTRTKFHGTIHFSNKPAKAMESINLSLL